MMLNFLKSWRDEGKTDIEEAVKSDAPLAMQQPSSDTKASILIGIIILLLGVGGFGFWAATAPLDEGVPAPGVVSVEFKRKTVAHLTGGVVKSIHVKEAQVIKEGAPLITLDDTMIRASYEGALQTYYALRAAESRLIAEQSGATRIVFPADLIHVPLHPLAAQHMAAQRDLFSARRAELASDLAVLDQSAETYELQASGYDEQLGFMKQELSGLRELAAEGYTARNQQLDLERQYSELANNTQHARRAAVETKLRVMQRRQEYRREVETQLADIRRDAANAAEHVKGLREELDRSIIRSPADGYVTGLAAHTIGGVVAPGMRLMDVVPSGEKLMFEVRIPSHLIDRVQVGLLADINLHTFPNEPQLVVEGEIISVSADLITDPNPSALPYYLSLVAVTPVGIKKLGTHQLQPGMPADVLIKTGERTLLTYLMKPLLRRLNAAMTEY